MARDQTSRDAGWSAGRTHADGFTLVELTVASSILFGVLVMMAYAGTEALANVGHARQRQAATGLANEALERVRSLPYGTVRRGLHNAEVVSGADPAIAACTRYGSPFFCFGSAGNSEIVVGSDNGTPLPPLVPHLQNRQVASTSYRVAAYVTHFKDRLNSNALRVTVQVTWDRPLRGRVPGRVELQTVIHPGSGCQSVATHPVSGPCQEFFYATAAVLPSSISIDGSILVPGADGTAGLLSEEHARLSLVQGRSVLQVEQVASTRGSAETSSSRLTTPLGEQLGGGAQVPTVGDTDPATSTPVTDHKDNLSKPQFDSVYDKGRYTDLRVQVSGGDRAESKSLGSAPAAGCRAGAPAGVMGLPCGWSSMRQAGTMSARLRLQPSPLLGEAALAVVGAPPYDGITPPGLALTERRRETAGRCAGSGCVRAEVARRFGTIELAGLPAGMSAPLGWAGYLVRLAGVVDGVSAEAGEATEAPVASVSAGTLEYWTGAAYATCSLAPAVLTACPEILPIATVVVGGGGYQIAITADDLQTGHPAAEGSCAGSICTASSARSSPPVTGTIRYLVTQGTVTVADLAIKIDLGSLLAKTSYQAGGA